MSPSSTTNITADDPDVQELLRSWGNPQTYSLSEIFETGPFGRSKGYEYINNGELPTFLLGSRRFVLALDYAKFLIALKRRGVSGASPAASRQARERRLAAIAATRTEAI
jgi:hypothetical protein